ncbi:hypothetical protein OKA05_18660 [Luteolibacter arcticus]|uniref:Uncharacterized protein n=1 Tax=Luteolibacter arcticus TaxID=1581411 RepID=A0ABT3GM32_9BACT|nr:hypothetical protein [Luteolibacter arcticus]MCW1924593.1 hypothetical protein [Luteolibacter arcticus]
MYSPSIRRLVAVVALAVALPVTVFADEEEIVIHRSEEFTLSDGAPKEEIHFVRKFAMSRAQWEKLPKAHTPAKPALSAAKAIELAEASLDPSETDRADSFHVEKLELRHQPAGDPPRPISFYLVDFKVDGSEVPRLVLMDGTVVKPELVRLPPKPPGQR